MDKTLYQMDRDNRLRFWHISVTGKFIHVEYGIEGGAVISTDDEGHVKNEGRSNEISADTDALNTANKLILKKLREGYKQYRPDSEPRAYNCLGDLLDSAAPLPLSLRFYKPENTLSARMEKLVAAQQALYTRKRDGEMMVIRKATDGSVDIFSRTMLQTHHADPDVPWAMRFPQLVSEITELVPNGTILLGDMVGSREHDERWKVASYMKSKFESIDEANEPYFYCWDIPIIGGESQIENETAGVRFGIINDIFCTSKRVVPVDVLRFATKEEALSHAKKNDWEGYVVVDPDGVYGDRGFNFRGKTERPGKVCCKLKPIYEDDFIAEFGEEGNGKNRGKLGMVKLYQLTPSGTPVYICDCGGGFSDEFRAEYADPAKFPVVMQIAYTERTYITDGDKTNALTHPRFLAIREDKEIIECVNPRLE